MPTHGKSACAGASSQCAVRNFVLWGLWSRSGHKANMARSERLVPTRIRVGSPDAVETPPRGWRLHGSHREGCAPSWDETGRRARSCAASSMSSYHMALRTAKAPASGRPRSQAKYHIAPSLSSVGVAAAVADRLGVHLAPQHAVDPRGVRGDERDEDAGDHEHDEQRQVA